MQEDQRHHRLGGTRLERKGQLERYWRETDCERYRLKRNRLRKVRTKEKQTEKCADLEMYRLRKVQTEGTD